MVRACGRLDHSHPTRSVLTERHIVISNRMPTRRTQGLAASLLLATALTPALAACGSDKPTPEVTNPRVTFTSSTPLPSTTSSPSEVTTRDVTASTKAPSTVTGSTSMSAGPQASEGSSSSSKPSSSSSSSSKKSSKSSSSSSSSSLSKKSSTTQNSPSSSQSSKHTKRNPSVSTSMVKKGSTTKHGTGRAVRIDVPSIGLHHRLDVIGTNGGVVSPDAYQLGVYRGYGRVNPGDNGISVIAGHVTYYGPDVLYRLSSLRQGSRFTITYANGGTRTFVTTSPPTSIDKDALQKNQRVWGQSSTPVVAFVTCDSGSRWENARHRANNLVVWAKPA